MNLTPAWLRERATDAAELMDNADADSATLVNTYEQFHLINSVVSGWSTTYRRFIRP